MSGVRRRRRKVVDLFVQVRVPASMSAWEVRREIRMLITHQCNVKADPGDVRAISVRRAPPTSPDAAEREG